MNWAISGYEALLVGGAWLFIYLVLCIIETNRIVQRIEKLLETKGPSSDKTEPGP